MSEEQDAPRFQAHALRSVGERKPQKHAKFLIANLELEFHVSLIRISDLKFSNRKKIAVFVLIFPSREAPSIFNTSRSLARSRVRSLVAPASCRLFHCFFRASSARAFSHFDAPRHIPYNRGILSA